MNKDAKKAKYCYTDKNGSVRNIELGKCVESIFSLVHGNRDRFANVKKDNDYITVIDDLSFQELSNFTGLRDSWIAIKDKDGYFTYFTNLHNFEYNLKSWCKIIKSSVDDMEYSFMEIPYDATGFEFKNFQIGDDVYCEHVKFDRKEKEPLIIKVNNKHYFNDFYKYLGDDPGKIFKDFDMVDIIGETTSKYFVFVNKQRKSSGSASRFLLPYMAMAMAATPSIQTSGGYPPERKRKS